MVLGFDPLSGGGLSEAPEDRMAFIGEAEWLLDWEVRIYAATHEYISHGSDVPPNQAYIGTLDRSSAFRLDRSVIGNTRIGEEITVGLGEVKLSNLEKDYDFLAVDHTPLGQEVTLWMFNKRRPKAEGRLILRGYMVEHSIDRNEITFSCRDGGHNLDVPASPNLYAGTGGAEGGDDLKGKSKPRVFGWVDEFTAPLVIPTSLAFQLNDGPINAVTAARVRGVEQTFSADYATVVLMNSAALTVGHYATCLAAGWGRIAVASDTEIGQVTWDLSGDKAGGIFVETAADIVRRLLAVTAFVDPDDLAEATFDTLNADQPAPLGYAIGVGDTQTVAAAISAIMASIGGWAGCRRSGRFEVRRFEAPNGTPTARYSKQDLRDVKLASLPSDLTPPPYRVKIGWGRVWTPNQTNLAGSVSDARRAYLNEEIRLASVEDLSVKADFPPGRDLIEVATYFRDETDALAEAGRKLELYGVSRALYVVQLCNPLFVHELGQVIGLQFDGRLDLDDEKAGRIVKLSESSAEGVEATVFT
jgi:hypothetical protein